MSRSSNYLSISKAFYGFGLALMTLLVLSAGKPVLMPVALSILLAFVLTPLVQFLEKRNLGRIVSVSIVSVMAICCISIASWGLTGQLNKLAEDLPNHEQEIRDKFTPFQLREDSTFGRLNTMLRNLLTGVESTGESSSDPSSSETVIIPKNKVVVAQEETSRIVSTIDVLLPIVEPFATAAFVVVLVLFILIRREDIRYRTISLLGDRALTGTTRLMQDTADRVSKYLFHLLLVNAGFGLWFAVGLYFLNVPYWPLWGFLTLFLRFIPFLGSPASIVFPLLISIATSTGWWQPVAIIIFFSVSELITANVIEPILFGKSTGLTPIALLIAALFWAWLWGPIGLLLSTPLTVCLVVLGQHLPALRSLKVLLAEQPILDPKLQLFQRLLAKDAFEANRLVTSHIVASSLELTVDDVVIPALKWARRERQSDSITAEEERFIYGALQQLLDLPSFVQEMTKLENVVTKDDDSGSLVAIEASRIARSKLTVIGYPVHHESEEVALSFLNRLALHDCDFQLLSTKLLPSQVLAQIQASKTEVAVLMVLPPGGLLQVQYICSELRTACPSIKILVTYLGKIRDYDRLLVRLRKIGVTYLTTSILQTSQLLTTLSEERGAGGCEIDSDTTSVISTPHLGRSPNQMAKTSHEEGVTSAG